nr:uncharacterized protein I203_05020 [Kwoniella mangroviensis CBS 8507]OCF65998.1 hypothetical protein I203_05020 [Kwoniella mangroviensis CBS 8507]
MPSSSKEIDRDPLGEDSSEAIHQLPRIGDSDINDNANKLSEKYIEPTVSVNEVNDKGYEPNIEQEEVIVVENADQLVSHVVDPRDDPDLPVLPFRFWFLGAGLACFGAVLAEIYYFKPQNASVSALFQLIIAYVLGNLMAAVIPSKGKWRYLNPGPFNIKEHAAIVIFSSTASVSTAEAVTIVAILNLYYNIEINPGVAIIQTWATQCVGYAVCGVLQSSLIYPTYAVWPETLPYMSLLQSMHFGGMLNKKRMKFFWIVFIAIFCWEIVPSWMFPLLTAVSIICLADNGRHTVVRQLFGAGSSNEGLGLFSFSFDWILITQAYPLCLVWPFNSQWNSWIGLLICYALMMGGYYSNVGEGRTNGLPFMSTSIFTSNGSKLDFISLHSLANMPKSHLESCSSLNSAEPSSAPPSIIVSTGECSVDPLHPPTWRIRYKNDRSSRILTDYYGIFRSIMSAHREILKDPVGSRIWSGWNLQGTNSKAITFGALGKQMYTGNGPYWFIPACLGIGLVLPIPFWLMYRRFPKQSIWRDLNTPIITNYMGWLPYSVNGMWWSGALIGFMSQWWARKYRPRWFVKYNCLLSASLDGGTQVIYFILNFALFGAAGAAKDFPYWWGNPDPSELSVDRCQAV